MKELISIVVPVYNAEKTLKRCVDSILNQHYQLFELILINDGSSDRSAELCEQYAKEYSKIKVYHQDNQGVAAVRNRGKKLATGKWITWCDSDDILAPNYLEELYNLTMKYNTSIAICTKQVVNNDLKNLENYEEGQDFSLSCEQFFEKMMYGELKGIGVSECGRLYRTEFLQDIVYPEGKSFEDSNTSYQVVIKNDKVAISLKPMYYYVRNEGSIVQSHFTPKRLEFIEAEENMTNAIEKIYPSLHQAALRRRVYAYLNTLGHVVLTGNKEYRLLEKKLKDKILQSYSPLISDNRVPKKDKLALVILKYFGLLGYRVSFKVFKIKQKRG